MSDAPPPQSLTVEFDMQPDDWVALNQAHAVMKGLTAYGFRMIGSFVVVGQLWVLSTGTATTVHYVVLFTFLFVLFTAFYEPSSGRFRRLLKKAEQTGHPLYPFGAHALTIDSVGLSWRQPAAEGAQDWSTIQRIQEAGGALCFYRGPLVAFFVPLRAFPNGDGKAFASAAEGWRLAALAAASAPPISKSSRETTV